MVDLYDARLYTEVESLATIKSFEDRQHFKCKSEKSRFNTMYGYSDVMAPLYLHVKLILKLQYPDIVLGYIDPVSHFQFFGYIPSLDTYIDYHESPWHRGPYGIPRSFDPGNHNDVKFVTQFSRSTHSKWLWMYQAKATTWGGADYRKLKFTKARGLKYLIYWTIQAVETGADPGIVQYARQLMHEQYMNVRLQSLYDAKLSELLMHNSGEHMHILRHYTLGKFELFDALPGLID